MINSGQGVDPGVGDIALRQNCGEQGAQSHMRADERRIVLLGIEDAASREAAHGGGNLVGAQAMDEVVLPALPGRREHGFVNMALHVIPNPILLDHDVTEKGSRSGLIRLREKAQSGDLAASKGRQPLGHGGVLFGQQSAVRFADPLQQQALVVQLSIQR